MIYVVLFRGINVGGKNPLPMKDLVALLESLGYRGVTSYIQSGNLALATDEADRATVAEHIASAIEGRFGFKPALMLVTLDEIEAIVADNPFPGGEADPKALHVAFLGAPPSTAKLGRLAGFAGSSEKWRLAGQTLYFWAPDGFGRSKFPAAAERMLGVPATFRNWRTVTTMRDLARQLAP